jgi:predicted dehydrogenase
MNVALIGCSGMGRVHAAMLTQAGFRLVLCVDVNMSAAEALGSAYGAEAAHDAAAAFQRRDVDVVCIATPTHTHAELVQAAARAGKHIFCEKPFCRTVAQCRRTMDVVKKSKVKLFVGHVVRYFQEFEAMRRQIAEGKVGVPGFVKLYRGGIFPGGPNSWFADYEKSGGVILDCMIHDLDWLRYVFGNPRRIAALTLQRSQPPLLDYAQVTVRMKNGVMALVIGTWAHPSGFRVKAEICGSEGMVEYDSHEAPVNAQKREVGVGPSMIVPSSPVDQSPYLLEWEDFRQWLQGKGSPRVTPEDAIWAVRMAEAALQSAREGKPVAL